MEEGSSGPGDGSRDPREAAGDERVPGTLRTLWDALRCAGFGGRGHTRSTVRDRRRADQSTVVPTRGPSPTPDPHQGGTTGAPHQTAGGGVGGRGGSGPQGLGERGRRRVRVKVKRSSELSSLDN